MRLRALWAAVAIVAVAAMVLARIGDASGGQIEAVFASEASRVVPSRDVWPVRPAVTAQSDPSPTSTVPVSLGPRSDATPIPTSDAAVASTVRAAAASVSTAVERATAEYRDPRFGIAIISGDATAIDHALTQARSGSWYSYGAGAPSTYGPPGKVHLLRVGPNTLSTSADESLRDVARAQPGSYWIVGNEPNVPGQDWVTGDLYPTAGRNHAIAYKRYRDVILGVDPTAKFVVGNMLNHATTCTGCSGIARGDTYLEALRAAYQSLYGTELPVDVWGLHLYVIDWDHPPMTDTAELIQNAEAFRAYVDSLPGGTGKPIWITEMGVIWGYQDYCWLGDHVTPDCRSSTTATATPRVVTARYAGQPSIEFPLASDAIDAYLATMMDWLLARSVSHRFERWFVYTNYGQPEPYTGVYAGVSLMDGSTANAGLTRFGRTYQSRAATAPTSTPTSPSGGGGGGGGGGFGATPTMTATRTPDNTPTVTPTVTPTATPTATFIPVSTTVPVNFVATTTVATSDGVLRIEIPAGGVAAANGTPVPVVVNVQTNPAPVTTDGVSRGLKAVRIEMQTQGGSPITQLTRSIVVEFAYSDSELAARGLNASSLRVYSSNDGVTWELLPATVDPATRRVRATTTHLTTFALTGSPFRQMIPMAPRGA